MIIIPLIVIYYAYIYTKLCVCMCVHVCTRAQLCHVQLFAPHGQYNPPGSSVCGISQARKLERVAISYSRVPSQLRNQTHVSCVSFTGRQILYHKHHLGRWYQVEHVPNYIKKWLHYTAWWKFKVQNYILWF